MPIENEIYYQENNSPLFLAVSKANWTVLIVFHLIMYSLDDEIFACYINIALYELQYWNDRVVPTMVHRSIHGPPRYTTSPL